MKDFLIYDQAELCSSVGLKMATINREKVYGSFTKNSDFAIYWALLRPVFMSMSIFIGNFYQSNIKMSNNMPYRNT